MLQPIIDLILACGRACAYPHWRSGRAEVWARRAHGQNKIGHAVPTRAHRKRWLAFVFVNYRTQLVPEIVFSGRIRVVKPGEVATGSTESSDVVVVKETFDTLRERVIRAAVLLR